jgi:hypothetical protein
MTLSFGDHVIDVERRELRRAKTPVHVEPQVFDLLVYLVQNRDRVVSKSPPSSRRFMLRKSFVPSANRRTAWTHGIW